MSNEELPIGAVEVYEDNGEPRYACGLSGPARVQALTDFYKRKPGARAWAWSPLRELRWEDVRWDTSGIPAEVAADRSIGRTDEDAQR